jgi:DnaK suppressor protein
MARRDAIKALRDVLLKRREALRRALSGDLSLLKELSDQSSGDVVDFALDSAHNEISSQLAEVESRELANVDMALERIREGTYGACESCNEQIPLARLQALPYATSCIDCQRELEKNGFGGRAPGLPRNILSTGVGDNETTLNDFEFDVT